MKDICCWVTFRQKTNKQSNLVRIRDWLMVPEWKLRAWPFFLPWPLPCLKVSRLGKHIVLRFCSSRVKLTQTDLNCRYISTLCVFPWHQTGVPCASRCKALVLWQNVDFCELGIRTGWSYMSSIEPGHNMSSISKLIHYRVNHPKVHTHGIRKLDYSLKYIV